MLTLGLVALTPLEASPQIRLRQRSQPQAGVADVAGQGWELRGVVLAGERRMAVLAHRADGRERIFAIGDVLTAGLVIARINEDRVILDADGRPVTLRLGHGGARTAAGRMAPPRTRSAIPPRRGSRR